MSIIWTNSSKSGLGDRLIDLFLVASMAKLYNITFYENFIDKNYSLDDYLNTFNDVLNEFKPTHNLTNIINELPNNIISIHLRRTDKCLNYIIGAHGIKE